MKNKILFIGISTILFCSSAALAGCGDGLAKGTEIPSADIRSEHVYEDCKCTDCGYVASLWNGEAAYNFESGTGTSEDPYIIANAEQLAFFAKTAENVSFSGQYIKLNANIDLNGMEWMPIGNDSAFAGNFDGAGHTVSSFKITNPTAYTGLFGSISGSVSNLKVENFFIGYNIADTSILGSTTMACSGGLAGSAGSAEITGCSIEEGRLFITASMGVLYTGGCVGRISAATKLNNIYADTDIFCEQYGDGSEVDCGGIAGASAGTRTGAIIENCFSGGGIEVKTKGENMFTTNSLIKVGGVVGDMDIGNISGCATDCNITISGKEQKKYLNIGSIAARKDKDFENCFSMDTQTFIRYSESLDFYNLDYSAQITRMTPEGVKTQLQLLWDSQIWSFDGTAPQLKLFL